MFCRPWSVPFAFKGVIEAELDRLEKSGVIRTFDHSAYVEILK